eukprot:m.67751 g.67751  ORF g.67751 m.67751 type:complete len:1029 (+) comp8463_c0_seq1:39-3125(+)
MMRAAVVALVACVSTVRGGGLSDHAVVGTAPNIPLSGDGSAATWTLSAPASDGQGCDTVSDTDFNTTQFIATVPASDAAACCAACRAHDGCLASVLASDSKTCTLHNLTGLMARVTRAGRQACFLGPAANGAVSIPARVPGDHLTDLQTAGLIDDPLFDVNFMNSSVWGARTWTYTATFTAPASLSQSGAVLLVFDGVKMGAHVRLNGQVIDTVKDQFLRYMYNVADSLHVGGTNTLELEFDQDIFVNGRFMACSGGWDWAPYATTYNRWGTKVFSLGIWKDVYLVPVAPKAAAITHVVPAIAYTGSYPTEPLTDATAAPFNINLKVHTWAASPTQGTLNVVAGWNTTHPMTWQTPDIDQGESVVSVNLTQAVGVKLWWPNGFGDQPLYNITTQLNFDNGPTDTNAVTTEATTRRVGFRYAVLVTGNDTDPAYVAAAATQDGSAPKGQMSTFIFRVNGAPVFAKGGNLVPMEELEGRSDADALRYLVMNAATAGFTILRNWGGGIFQYDAYYDALDEFGILCYQDLMYAQGQHSPTYGDPTQAAEIAHQVRRLSHHPSLAVYTSCNECIFHGNMTLYVNFAMEVVAAEVSTTPLWPSCPAPGWKSGVNRLTGYPNGNPLVIGGHTLDLHGPYIKGCTTAFEPADGCFGEEAQDPFKVSTQMLVNQSIWPPWGRSGPIGVGLQGTVFSEYGFTVMSSFESMSATLSPENWGVNQPAFAQRNYPCDNFIHAFFGKEHSNTKAVGALALQRQTWQCMIAQALAQKQYTEALRSMNTVLVQFWQYNEIWPTGGWGSIEYGTPVKGQVIGGRWKPLQHLLKRSVFAIVGAACMDDGRCYVRNDGKTPFVGALRTSLIKLATGESVWNATQPLSIARGAHTVQWVCVKGTYAPDTNCTSWDTVLADAGCTTATCVFNADVFNTSTVVAASTSDRPLSSNQQLLLPPGQLQVVLDANVSAVVGAANADGTIPVTVTATATALLVTLTTLAPGVFSDNVFLLTPHTPAALVFTPYGQVTADDVRSSLRVVHLAQYL